MMVCAVSLVAQTAGFEARCAACHAAGNTVGAPPFATLRGMPWQAILSALETGKMKTVGSGMSAAEREALAKSIGIAGEPPATGSSRCAGQPPVRANRPAWNGWADAANTRFQSSAAAGLTVRTTPKLKLKWAFGFSGVTTAFGNVTVFGGRVFVGAADGAVNSLDARTGCTYWTYKAEAGVRVAPVIDDSGRAAYFGDLRGNVYAVDVASGMLIWKVRAEEHPAGSDHRISEAPCGAALRSRFRPG